MSFVRERANFILDTSNFNIYQLRRHVIELIEGEAAEQHMVINIISFGFKYGLPLEADLVMDVRCLPNPQYVPTLRSYSGNDKKVEDYVLGQPDTSSLLGKYIDLLMFLVPLYRKEGKVYLTIGIGCTGGQHRSVVIANHIKKYLDSKGEDVKILHRDVSRIEEIPA